MSVLSPASSTVPTCGPWPWTSIARRSPPSTCTSTGPARQFIQQPRCCPGRRFTQPAEHVGRTLALPEQQLVDVVADQACQRQSSLGHGACDDHRCAATQRQLHGAGVGGRFGMQDECRHRVTERRPVAADITHLQPDRTLVCLRVQTQLRPAQSAQAAANIRRFGARLPAQEAHSSRHRTRRVRPSSPLSAQASICESARAGTGVSVKRGGPPAISS